MDFTEKMKELIAGGASIDEIASSFGLDVKVLPPEWILFFSNSIMLTCSMIHDCFSPYFKLTNVEHAICLQHIQRELRAAAIREKVEAEYFRDLESFLLEMRKAKMDAMEEGKASLDNKTIEEYRRRFRLKIANGLSKFRKPKRCRLKLGKIPEGKTRSLLLRLQEKEDAVFKQCR